MRNLRDQKNPIPVLLLTARDSLVERVEGLNLGADDYLTKPFYVEELIARLNTIVRRTHGQALSILQVGDLRVEMLEAVDARMSLPASAFSRQATPWMDADDFRRLTARFTEERVSEISRPSWVVVMRNDSATIVSESQAGIAESLALENHLPLPGAFVEGPSFLSGQPDPQPSLPRPIRRAGPLPRHSAGPSRLHRPPLFFTTEDGGKRWRVGAFSSLFATVFVGMDLGPFDRQILRMRRLCLTTLLGALGLTALAGRLVANKAMRPVHRLKKITEALLTLSRADSGSLQLDKRTFSMSEALESFCEDAEILCSEKALTFSCEIEPGLAVHSDRAVILSVFHNLLSNAMKYNEPDGQVRIRARRRGQFAEVEIANSGPPITERQRLQIFRRFYRGEEARSRLQGWIR